MRHGLVAFGRTEVDVREQVARSALQPARARRVAADHASVLGVLTLVGRLALNIIVGLAKLRRIDQLAAADGAIDAVFGTVAQNDRAWKTWRCVGLASRRGYSGAAQEDTAEVAGALAVVDPAAGNGARSRVASRAIATHASTTAGVDFSARPRLATRAFPARRTASATRGGSTGAVVSRTAAREPAVPRTARGGTPNRRAAACAGLSRTKQSRVATATTCCKEQTATDGEHSHHGPPARGELRCPLDGGAT